MPITSYFTKNNRQMAFSYNPISMVRAGKPESFFHCDFIKVSFFSLLKNEESLLIFASILSFVDPVLIFFWIYVMVKQHSRMNLFFLFPFRIVVSIANSIVPSFPLIYTWSFIFAFKFVKIGTKLVPSN